MLTWTQLGGYLSIVVTEFAGGVGVGDLALCASEQRGVCLG